MGESVETMVLVLGGDVLGRHRLGGLEARVLRYIMQQRVAYRFLWVLHGDGFRYDSDWERDKAKELDSIYYDIPLIDLADELGVNVDDIADEVRSVFKHLTKNVFIQNKRGVNEDSLRGTILHRGRNEDKVDYFEQIDDNWCYEPLFTRVEINKQAVIIDMKGSVLNLLLTADLDQYSDNRFKSMYSRLVNNAIYHHLGVDPRAKDNLVDGLNNFRVTIDLDELRRWTCTTEKYERYSQFKERVLDVAVGEITKWGDYTVSYEVIKTGTKVTGIEFIGSVKDEARKEFRTGLLILTGTQSDMLVMRALLAQKGINCTPEEAYELHQLYSKDSVRYFADDLDFVTAKVEEQELRLMDISTPWSAPDCYVEDEEGELFKNLIIGGEREIERGADGRIKDPFKYLRGIQVNRLKEREDVEKRDLKEAVRIEVLAEVGSAINPLDGFKYDNGNFSDEDEEY